MSSKYPLPLNCSTWNVLPLPSCQTPQSFALSPAQARYVCPLSVVYWKLVTLVVARGPGIGRSAFGAGAAVTGLEADGTCRFMFKRTSTRSSDAPSALNPNDRWLGGGR